MALVNAANQIVNVPTHKFNVLYDALHNEFQGKDERKYANVRKHLKEVQILPINGGMFSIGERAVLKG